MIAEKFVDLYAHNSGVRDKLVAERDVVLTYALRALYDSGLLKDLAFKGGTALRKMVFGSTGRFSEDLDFTLASARKPDDVFIDVLSAFTRTYHGITFELDEEYRTIDERSFGADVAYRHSWNETGLFHLEISLRKEPTLPVSALPMKEQSYFKQLEFKPFDIPCLAPIEMAAEKVRAAFQRSKVRDLYDLWLFCSKPIKVELLRALVVLKLWNVKDAFDAEPFFKKIESGKYDWDDLMRLLRSTEKLEAATVKAGIKKRFAVLAKLTEREKTVVAGARTGKAKKEAKELRDEARRFFTK